MSPHSPYDRNHSVAFWSASLSPSMNSSQITCSQGPCNYDGAVTIADSRRLGQGAALSASLPQKGPDGVLGAGGRAGVQEAGALGGPEEKGLWMCA